MIFVVDFDYIDPNYLGVQTAHVTSGRHYINGSTMYMPVVLPGFTFETQLYSQGTTKGSVTVGVGQLTLANVDGALDFLRNCGVDGQRIKIWAALNEDDPLTTSNLYFVGTIFYAHPNFDTVTLYVKDRTESLNIPAQTSVFAGTNAGATGLEGTATDIGGKPKPMLYGRCFNVPLYQLNSSILMYGCNYDNTGTAKAIARVWNVYDKGGKLQFAADYATSALLQAATVPAGNYATCLAAAEFKLGSVPQGTITVDVDENTLALSSVPMIVKRYLTDQGFVDGVDFHGGLLDQLHVLNNCPAGIFISDQSETHLSVITDLLNSIGAWSAPDRFGIFQFGRFDLAANTPQVSAITVTRNLYKSGTLDRPMTGDQNYGIPATKVNVHHSKRWVTQQPGDLLPSLEPKLITFLGLPDTIATAQNTAVKTLHALAPTIDYDTLLAAPMGGIAINAEFDYPILPSSAYSPLNAVNGGISPGWVFSSVLDGHFSQNQFGINLVATTGGDATITQVLNIPSQINVLNTYTLQINASIGSSGTTVTVTQGSTLVNSTLTTFGPGAQSANVFSFTTLNSATPVTIKISVPSGGSNFAYINAVTLINASPDTVLNGSELNAPVNGSNIWTSVLGTGATVTQAGGLTTLTPAAGGSAALQASLALPVQMFPGQYTLVVNVHTGATGTVTVVQNAITLATKNITAAGNVVLNFNITSTANPAIITITDPAAAAAIKIAGVTLRAFLTAGLQNGNFALPIPNANSGTGSGSLFNSPSLNGGWYFAAGANTSYSQANSRLTLTGTSVALNPTVSQNFSVPDQLQAGATFSISINVVSFTGSPFVSIQQGITTLLGLSLVVGINTFSFTVPATGTAVVVSISADITSQLVLESATITEVTGTLTPQDEANRLNTLEGSNLERYTFDMLFEDAMFLKPGDKLTLLENRFGLNAGKDFTFIGIKHDEGADAISLDVAG